MNFRNILEGLQRFFERYRTAIITGLLFIVIGQQCTISSLRQQVALREKMPVVQEMVDEDDFVNGNESEGDVNEVVSERQGKDWTRYQLVILVLAIVVAYWFVAKKRNLPPFMVSASGKIWQDLTGRVIFSINISNRTNENATIDSALIEFVGIRDSRKFKVPVADFPLTLTPMTKHKVNISLQKILEHDASLRDYKAIRATIMKGGKAIRTLPVGVRWK